MGGTLDRSWHGAYTLLFAADLSLAEGDNQAAASAAEAIARNEEGFDQQAIGWAARVMAEIEILDGRPEMANARLLPLLDRPSAEEHDATGFLPVIALAYLEQDQVNDAARIVDRALANARGDHLNVMLVEALRVRAMIALRQGDWVAAEASLEEGLSLARVMPYPYAEARLLHIKGQVRAVNHVTQSAGEVLTGTSADDQLTAALVIFQRLGAHRDVAEVERDLEALVAERHRLASSARRGNR